VGLIDRTFTSIDDFDTLGRYGRYTEQNFTVTNQEQPLFDYDNCYCEPEYQKYSLKFKLNLSKRIRQVFFEKKTPNKIYLSNYKQKKIHLKNRRPFRLKSGVNNPLNTRSDEFSQKNINLEKHPSSIFLKKPLKTSFNTLWKNNTPKKKKHPRLT
jgi:hypothetical protein